MIQKEEIFEEFTQHLLKDYKPSLYFDKVFKEGILKDEYPFNFLWDLIKIEQSPKHHPEGNVWKHTMMVLDKAAENRHLSENPRIFMWAALLHDIGKAPTTKLRKGRLTAYDHDKVGAGMVIKFLEQFTDDKDFIKKVSLLVRWHMQPLFIAKNMPFGELDKMLEQVSPDEIALLSVCDRLGRGKMTEEKAKEEKESIEKFLKRAKEKAEDMLTV
ncbi:putative nucleotidyltransferase with HDIG domain [Clostridium tetanomorphum]|uniref:HDIG domain-containing protein n=1 Tax=Clostridium tetanomorphum TaxID=1553 RepID=A0A923J0J8_CLOTT|nr:HDIG domain-containing metalloprotein [Clostridium tetanomorphum]KAJ51149.1 poly A polymerase [Clostridium tetanomorphum DSM 665]MBC2398157.1 HDIG domain-containing protein [Clostridium tetanomorphum]MBP1864422.1 putative nucleotidyltransferase with HDIG domain [Clostridium tetanomorphum]NRS83047.1 putative nucleotidyltransferase with HDIG domain [Clostridium tetanomorphum]NRZ98856.1 putative nucleotidyltransferase with HDIG domain [Clostridium tetanomorphum]